jgi:hypothetical protein
MKYWFYKLIGRKIEDFSCFLKRSRRAGSHFLFVKRESDKENDLRASRP